MMQLSPRVEQPDKCNLPAGRSEYVDGTASGRGQAGHGTLRRSTKSEMLRSGKRRVISNGTIRHDLPR
eukprot:5683397-Pleurochrysis_carterae.AAC.1